jgi:hypothetical protein
MYALLLFAATIVKLPNLLSVFVINPTRSNPPVAAPDPDDPLIQDEVYPLVAIAALPTCILTALFPFVLTPFSITVIRFTQDGMPVKSMLVPLVVATAVESVSG